MTSKEEAISHWESVKAGFKKERPTRTVVLGDGRGSAASNLKVPGQPQKQYARRRLGDKNYFVITNRRVAPKFNLPVVLGYTDEDPDIEQVLDQHTAGWQFTDSASTIGGIDQHHTQHQFGGGDEVSVDPRLFTPGLIKPQSTPSMKVDVMPFTHYYRSWSRFPKTASSDLSDWKPPAGKTRYVLIALDPITNSLVYRPGTPSASTGGFGGVAGASVGGGMGAIPAPAGDEYPLGAVKLTSTTTELNWNSVVNNIEETRLHITPPFQRILDRLDQLEGITGNATNLPCTGAA